MEDNLEEERLQKFIANQGICSRRKAEEYITSGNRISDKNKSCERYSRNRWKEDI